MRNPCKQRSLPNLWACGNREFCSLQSINVDVLICYPLGRCYYTDYSFFLFLKKKRFTEEIKSLLKKDPKRVRWGKEFKHLIGVSELGNLYGLYSPWDFPRVEYLKVTNRSLETPSNK